MKIITDMKNFIIFMLVLIVVIVALLSFWGLVLKFEKPIKMLRAIRALNNGREYEVIHEEKIYLTHAENYVDLMRFLEGHYGYEYSQTLGDDFYFNYDGKEVIYKTDSILNRYWIWYKQ